MLIAVDLPSCGDELVTTITRGGLSTARNCRFVRSFLKASAIPGIIALKGDRCVLSALLIERNAPNQPEAGYCFEGATVLTVLSKPIANYREAQTKDETRTKAEHNIARRVRNNRLLGMEARCSTTTRASGLASPTAVSPIPHQHHKFVGQCVCNVACTYGRLVKHLRHRSVRCQAWRWR